MDKNAMLIKKAIKKYNLPENVEYKTFDQWRASGMYVKKGQKAAFKVKLWSGLNAKKDFYFFSEDQVEYKEHIAKRHEAELEALEIEEQNKYSQKLKKEIRRFTRSKAVNPGTAASDIVDFNEFKKQNFGSIMFSKNSKYYIEDLYLELANIWPDVFKGDEINEADMLIEICDSINNIKAIEPECKSNSNYSGWFEDGGELAFI